MTEKFKIDNRLSLVASGSKGIGFGVSKALAEAGADIVLVARNSEAGSNRWIESFVETR